MPNPTIINQGYFKRYVIDTVNCRVWIYNIEKQGTPPALGNQVADINIDQNTEIKDLNLDSFLSLQALGGDVHMVLYSASNQYVDAALAPIGAITNYTTLLGFLRTMQQACRCCP